MIKQTDSAPGVTPPRLRPLRAFLWTLGGLAGAYLVVRGVAEFFTVDYGNPASYRLDWGGPSLAGVFAVHSGPGLLVLIAAAGYVWRRARSSHRGAAGR